jgi:hypothetical protein
VQVVVDDVRVRLDGEAAWSETTVTTAGPWVLTLITVVPDLGVRLISSYLGGEHVATGATHVLTPPAKASSSSANTAETPCRSRTHASGACSTTAPSCSARSSR